LNTGSSGVILYATYCSRKKNPGRHLPDKLYKSKRITDFIEYCRRNGLNWAILSAKYGLIFPDREVESYDVTLRSNKRDCRGRVDKYLLGVCVIENGNPLFIDESNKHLENLIFQITRTSTRKEYQENSFYAPIPQRAKSYLAVLHAAFDDCWEKHESDDLLEHLKKSKYIEVITKLE